MIELKINMVLQGGVQKKNLLQKAGLTQKSNTSPLRNVKIDHPTTKFEKSMRRGLYFFFKKIPNKGSILDSRRKGMGYGPLLPFQFFCLFKPLISTFR